MGACAHVQVLCPFLSAPRVYPVPFAREILDLVEDLKKASKAQPELPNHVPPATPTVCQGLGEYE